MVELWQAARARQVPGDRHALRWVPARAFDLFDLDPLADPGSPQPPRTVAAAPGFPLCRLRQGQRLGFEQDGACRIVDGDPPPALPADSPAMLPPVAITTYHAGRCLDVDGASGRDGARVQQWTCNGGDNQRWSLRGGPVAGWALVNAGSGRCLDRAVMATGLAGLTMGASFGQRACDGSPGQLWQAVRTGNTFSLRGADARCLEVAGQSRADGAALVLAACTGAAHQQWQIESLRAGDHERLYQAERDRIAWLAAPDAAHPLPVTVDGLRPVCRSLDPQPWVGVASATTCSGRTYAGAPATTDRFERLFQAPW